MLYHGNYDPKLGKNVLHTLLIKASNEQCDQMTRLFVQYLAIYINVNSEEGSKFCQILNKRSKDGQILTNFCQRVVNFRPIWSPWLRELTFGSFLFYNMAHSCGKKVLW